MTEPNSEFNNQPNQRTYYYCVEVNETTTANGYIFGSTNYDVVQQLDTKYNHPKRIHAKCVSDNNIIEISRFENQTKNPKGENKNG